MASMTRSQEILASQLAEKEMRRLFILGVKDIDEDELRQIFSKFGTLAEVKKTYDKQGLDRGIAYVSYEKTSEAFRACEEGDGFSPTSKPNRSLRVNISKNAKDEPKNSETMLDRLFLRVSTDVTEDRLKDEFGQWGIVKHVKIIRDKETNQSRGMAFVTFDRKVSSALALEQCSPEYQASFAEKKFTEHSGAFPLPPMGPRPPMSRFGKVLGPPHQPPPPEYGVRPGPPPPGQFRPGLVRPGFEPGIRPPPRAGFEDAPPRHPHPDRAVQAMIEGSGTPGPRGSCTVLVKGCSHMSEKQLFQLFDIVPGLVHCKINSATGMGSVRYETPECAAHASVKIHKFEYPPGILECSLQPHLPSGLASAAEKLKESLHNITSGETDLDTIVGSLQKATEALQFAGGMSQDVGLERLKWCSVPLPPRQPQAKGAMAEKLFIHLLVEKLPGQRGGHLPPTFQAMLTDAFCRFGNLINLSVLMTKSCAFAQYKKKESAERALHTLNGQTVGPARLRVMFADNFKDRDTKREGSALDANGDAKRPRNEME